MATVERSFENGAVLGVLTLALAITGILLSPSLGLEQSNVLYAIHVALGLLLIAALLWHVVPLVMRLAQRLDSLLLTVLLVVEVWTGIEIWRHVYLPFPKAIAVLVHLAFTLMLLVPLVTHTVKGTRVWWAQRTKRASIVSPARRVILRLGAYGALAVGLAYAFGTAAKEEVEEWRLNSIGRTPQLTKESYRLRITGLVNRPIELTWDDLMALRQLEQRFTHHCVEGWTYTDTFIGIPLPDIINMAGGAKPEARTLIFKSPETSTNYVTEGQQYTTNFPLEDGLFDDVLLVHKAHGEDLPAEHGYPLRLMTPRKWGYKACKWLTEIELSANDEYRGYWERNGYHPDGDYPGPIFG